MTKSEGVIKFQLQYTPSAALRAEELHLVNHWRQVLYAHNLIGQDAHRYGGYGFGNISQRLPPFDAPPHQRRFAISGTQTGGLPLLTPEQYAIVTECDPDRNLIIAAGPIRPSSESLTHGTLYDLDASLRFVLHAHSPHIWHHAAALGLPTTNAEVAYGSPEMAAEVRRLFRESDVTTRLVFSMGGHEDGIVAFGRDAEEAGNALLACLEQATRL